MTPFQLPLQPFNQKFTVSLDGTVYQCRCVWNAANGAWSLDINDQNGNPIFNGIPLVTGSDLLGQVKYLMIGGVGGQMVAQSSFDPNQVPTFADLGSTGNLYFVTQ